MTDLYGSRALTPTQAKLVALIAEGLGNKQIGSRMGTTEGVIKIYCQRVYDKLGLGSKLQVALWYTQQEFVRNGK